LNPSMIIYFHVVKGGNCLLGKLNDYQIFY